MFEYSAYCQKILSDIELPEFRQDLTRKRVDLSIYKHNSTFPIKFHPKEILAEKLVDCLQYTCPNRVRYRISDGTSISMFSDGTVQAELERLPLSGFAMAAVLCQRGSWVFHGSAVEVNGNAVVITGEKMAGKSTLIANLIEQGCRLISDDVTAISIEKDGVYVLPGIPNIKIWPDAAAGLGIDIKDLSKIFPDTEKRNYNTIEKFCDQKRKLDTVVVLEKGDILKMMKLPIIEKMLSLSCSHYLARFQHLFSSQEKEKIFRQCAFLTRNVEVLRFIRPWNLELLPQAAGVISSNDYKKLF